MGEKKYGMAHEYSQQDIINALNLLKDVCMASGCDSCPLRATNWREDGISISRLCAVVKSVPGDWDINTIKDFRAFKGDGE